MRSLTAPPGGPGAAGADAAQALFREARRRRRQRWLAGIAAVVVTAAVLAVSAVTWLPRALGQFHHRTGAAGAAVAGQPEVRPGQWVYRKTTTENSPGDHIDPRFFITTIWSTADDSQQAIYWDAKRGGLVNRGGQLRVVRALPRPPVPYSAIGSAPTDPRALVTYLRHLVQHPRVPQADLPHFSYPAWWWDAQVFRAIWSMLTSYIMPPRFTAELFRALGDIPGVTINQNAVDVTGQRGVGFRFHPPRATIRSEEIILSRRTYAYIGAYFFGRFGGTALLRQALVSGPGVRP